MRPRDTGRQRDRGTEGQEKGRRVGRNCKTRTVKYRRLVNFRDEGIKDNERKEREERERKRESKSEYPFHVC